jgi:hypothetical protein
MSAATHKLPAAGYSSPTLAGSSCATCAFWPGDTRYGSTAAGICRNPQSLRERELVRAYETCGDWCRDEGEA